MPMQPAQWQPVPGTQTAQVCPYLRKPDVFSSNSYVLRFSQQLVVIDPGGRPEQTQTLVSLVREIMQAEATPVSILLTHCHVDHTLETMRNGLWRAFPSLRVVIQEHGARALSTGDRRLTQAEILECELPAGQTDLSLFKSSSRETAVAPLLPGAAEWIPLGASDAVEAYFTPGHSPDGVCFRVGEMLFVGDLIAAVSPLIAGAPGWDHKALIRSLERILQLLQTRRIHACGLGHGDLLIGDAIAAAFRRALAEASSLTRIEALDVRRVRWVSQSAQELCEELSLLFGTIHRTIDHVAERLHALEEFSAADQVRQVLRSDVVSELLAEFRNFREGLLAGEFIEVQLALKGVQVVHRISRLLEYDKLVKVVNPALLSVTRLSLADFLQAAKGLRMDEPQTEVDVSAHVTALVAELSHPLGARSLEDVPDDPAGFREYLIASIAVASALKSVSWRIAPSMGTTKGLLSPPRFHDTLKCLLLDLAEAGAKEIAFSTPSVPAGNSLLIQAESGRPLFGFSESQVGPYRRRFGRMGVKLATKYLRTGLILTLEFTEPPIT